MTSSVGANSGGGIHPGAPMIWPTSKEKKVEQSKSSESTASASQAKAQAAPSAAARAAQSQAAATAAPAAPAKPAPPPTRAMAMPDIAEALINSNIPSSAENTQLASLMVQHGLELSGDHFSDLFAMLKGDKKVGTMESAVLSLSKGLNGNERTVPTLAKFLSENPQLAQQMQNAQSQLMNLQSALQRNQAMLDPQLTAQLGALLSEFDDDLKKKTRLDDDGKMQITPGDREGMTEDLRALQKLMMGLEQKLAAEGKLFSPEAKDLKESLGQVRQNIGDLLDNLMAQAILSKDSKRLPSGVTDQYVFLQLVNPFLTRPGQIELLIRKDGTTEKSSVNPRKTRIIISLDTPDLGKITIIIDILDRKIWYIFNTDSDKANSFIQKTTADLRDRMAQLNFQLVGARAIQKRVDINRYIKPTANLDNMIRINLEA